MSRQLGDYLLGDIVEEDTHTVTYRAEKPGDGRALLAKVLKPGLKPSRRLRSELEAERKLLLELAHPGLPTVLGRFRSKETLALLLVDPGGYRLSDVLSKAPTHDHHSAAAIGLGLAEVLAAVHRAGIVHGHVKPQLVELTGAGQLVLHGLRPAHHRTKQALETPAELTPEQLLGRTPAPQTDIFLVGMLLYRMLAGRGPFDEQDGDRGMGQRVRVAQPDKLPTRTPPIPAGLSRIVMRCLSKRPVDRFADMPSLAAALETELRAGCTLPRDLLVSQALQQAGLAEALAKPAEYHPAPAATARIWAGWPRRVVFGAAAAVAAVAVLLLWQWSSRPTRGVDTTARGIVQAAAYVRVLAQPWAEVFVDGKPADTTPVARPIEVPPGQHTFLFRHPNAPDETRTVEVIAGQTILLDVQMQVVRPQPSAVPAPSSEAASP